MPQVKVGFDSEALRVAHQLVKQVCAAVGPALSEELALAFLVGHAGVDHECRCAVSREHCVSASNGCLADRLPLRR